MLELIRDTLRGIELVGDTPGLDATELPDTVKRLLSVMKNEALSAIELMKRLGLAHRPTFRRNYLNPALELGIIVTTIPDKP